MAPNKHFNSFAEFYPYYLTQHLNPICRVLHLIGTSLAALCVALAVLSLSGTWLVAAPLCAYSLAWVGHFFFEKNRPATFHSPLWSLRGDLLMTFEVLTGQRPLDETAPPQHKR
ncbi:MAG: hypothetical protein MHM6MM_003812 [Cercozoa sp. M6MM]